MSWIGLTLVENFANLNLINPTKIQPKKKKKTQPMKYELTKAKSRLIKKRKEVPRLHIGFVELVD